MVIKKMRVSSSRKISIVLFFLYCAILFGLYANYFFSDEIIMSGDALQVFTDGHLLTESLSSGEIPLWNKYLSLGVPFYNYSPVFLLNFISYKAMVYGSYIGFVAIGATFFFKYLEKIGCSRWAAICISICYLLSTHIGGYRKSHPHLIFTIVLLPVILYFIEKYFSTRKLRWLLCSSTFMALQFVVGFQQQVIYSDIFLAIYLLVFGFQNVPVASLVVPTAKLNA